MATTPTATTATLEVEIVKGYRTYSVKDATGAEVARAHCVQVKLGLYTLVVGGKWSGVAAEAVTVATLRGMADKVTGPADAVAFVESCAA